MICQVYVKNEKLTVTFDKTSIVYDRLSFPLGDAAVDFAAFPRNVFRKILSKHRDAFLTLCAHNASYEATFDTMKELVVATSGVNTYLNFYMEQYIKYLLCLLGNEFDDDPFLLQKIMEGFLLDNGADADPSTANFFDFKEACQWGLDTFMRDYKHRQLRLKEDFDAITGSAEEFKGLNPMQRLYFLSKQGRNYLSGEFKTTLMPDYAPIPDNLDEIKSTLLEHKVDVVEMVGIESIDNLLGFELFHTLKADMPLRKCKHCGEYFIVHKRSDTEYCDRQKIGETKPCSAIGAVRKYWDDKAGNEVYAEFQKAYKRNHSRRRAGTMTEQAFFEWSEEARRLRGECEAGRVALEEFRGWLGNR